ncbi:MAG: hypothetical protein ACRCYE_11210 [Sarcina sp.]
MTKKKLLFFIFLFITVFKTNAFASSSINLDGNFDDWNDKPILNDIQGDSNVQNEDLKILKYSVDENNLYIYVERYNSSPLDLNWNLQVILFNGTGYTSNHYTPWDNPKDNFQWKSTNATTIQVTISTMGSEQLPMISTTLDDKFRSASLDGRKIEFSIPLTKIGLTPHDIKLAVKSPTYSDAPHIDWIPENGPLYIVDGPILGKLNLIILPITFTLLSFYIKRNIDNMYK